MGRARCPTWSTASSGGDGQTVLMNSYAILFLLCNGAALLLSPRRWAPLPLLAGACYMTLGQGFDLGPFSFTVIRVLVGIGLIRCWIRGEKLSGGFNSMDKVLLVWGVWAIASSMFHKEPGAALIFRFGLVYNVWGIYFLLRIFCQDVEDVIRLSCATALLLVPVALEMVLEHATGRNLFSALGGVPEAPMVREGRIRAQGPFAHAILAGTVGATALPLMIGIWRWRPCLAKVGAAACVVMALACSSSGPILSGLAGLFALWCWKWRDNMRALRWAAVGLYVLLDLVMKAPAYYVIARIDVVGGSTGWHRARLIESALEHLGEWWFAGTDYTRHWMATGVSWSPEHSDITNYYIQMGVWGGLPLMILFIVALWLAFKAVGLAVRSLEGQSPRMAFFVWSLGACLFAHAATAISVSYFDQSFVFLYSALAGAGSVATAIAVQMPAVTEPPEDLESASAVKSQLRSV